MKHEKEQLRPCGNEGCLRKASDGRSFCDTCDLEWALYRRDLRTPAPSPRP